MEKHIEHFDRQQFLYWLIINDYIEHYCDSIKRQELLKSKCKEEPSLLEDETFLLLYQQNIKIFTGYLKAYIAENEEE